MHGILMLVVLVLLNILVTNTAAQSCPANLNSEAQIVLVFDRTVPLDDLPGGVMDTNLTFFREVLGYNDAQIQQETQSAFQFLNERFGLDFSLSQGPMNKAFTSSKMPPFNRLDDPLLMQPSIAGQSLEVPSRDALRQLLVDSLSALLESRH